MLLYASSFQLLCVGLYWVCAPSSYPFMYVYVILLYFQKRLRYSQGVTCLFVPIILKNVLQKIFIILGRCYKHIKKLYIFYCMYISWCHGHLGGPKNNFYCMCLILLSVCPCLQFVVCKLCESDVCYFIAK